MKSDPFPRRDTRGPGYLSQQECGYYLRAAGLSETD
jgi:hypothetical protein